MMRSVPEWKGKTDDTKPPKRVLVRIFERYDGKDYLTGQTIRPGSPWQADHIIAISNGGENTESNLAPLLVPTHKRKTRTDMKTKSKIARTRKKHLGLAKPGWWKPDGIKFNWGSGRYER